MLETGLSQLLTTTPAVAALIGTRVYPVVWPNDTPTFPLCTYQVISTTTASALAGPLSLATCRVQFDVWAKGYLAGKAAAAAINDALEGYSGTLPDGTVVSNISLDSSQDLYDSPTSTNRVSSDYLVTFYR